MKTKLIKYKNGYFIKCPSGFLDELNIDPKTDEVVLTVEDEQLIIELYET